MEETNLIQRITAIEDKIAVKELIDQFSLVSDRKDNIAQASFFTEDGILQSIMDGATLTFSGRKDIEEGFAEILAPLETVYHHNGQSLITVNGDSGTGYSYCLATLIGKKNGKTYHRMIAANYADEYSKANNQWLIAKRTATVAWEETKEL